MSRMMECANESEAVFPETDPAAKLRARIYMGFAGTMALGLSLAGWYVGGRILATEQPSTVALASPAIISPVQGSAPQSAPPVLTAKESSNSAADANVVLPVQLADLHPEVVEPPVGPPAPQLFLEVAGLGARQDALFVKRLHLKGFSARIDAASNEEIRRILIGPFADRQAFEKAQRKLQGLGILALERAF